MSELSNTRPASPCINLCRMDNEDRYCLGCFRTLDEITLWSDLNAEEKELVWQALEKRRHTQT